MTAKQPGRGSAGQKDRRAGAAVVVQKSQPAPPQRLQKILSAAGFASRRASEELIRAGRVTVNGKVVTVGTKVRPGRDRIAVDGQPVEQSEALAYVAAFKPRGMITTLLDPQGRPTVAELVREVPVRVFPVGRLDYDSEGLLLLTNDGELADGLMHPRRQIWKHYVARVRGVPSAVKLRQLEDGIELEDGPTAPARPRLLRVLKDERNARNQVALVEIAIHEGRNRQVRRMFMAIGHEVIGLRRVGIGPLRLERLNPGGIRYLRREEIRLLRQAVGLSPDPSRPLLLSPGGERPRPEPITSRPTPPLRAPWGGRQSAQKKPDRPVLPGRGIPSKSPRRSK